MPLGSAPSGSLLIGLLLRLLRRRNLERSSRRSTASARLLRQTLRTSLAAAAVAHEIDQTLSSLSLISERLIQQAEATPGRAKSLPLIQVLLTECQRVVVLIEKIRMLFQSVESEQGPVLLIDATTSALTDLWRSIAAADVQLQATKITGPGTVIHGDGAQLQVAITNLLRNALAALLEGPRQQRQWAVTLRELPAWVELVVADSGPGSAQWAGTGSHRGQPVPILRGHGDGPRALSGGRHGGK